LHLRQMRDELRKRSTLAAQHPTETGKQLRVRKMIKPPKAIATIHDRSIPHRLSSLPVPHQGPSARAHARIRIIFANAAHGAAHAPCRATPARLADSCVSMPPNSVNRDRLVRMFLTRSAQTNANAATLPASHTPSNSADRPKPIRAARIQVPLRACGTLRCLPSPLAPPRETPIRAAPIRAARIQVSAAARGPLAPCSPPSLLAREVRS